MTATSRCVERTPSPYPRVPAFLAGLLVGAVGLTIGLRPDLATPTARAQEGAQAVASVDAKPAPPAAKLADAPYSLDYIPRDAAGMVAIRPARLLNGPLGGLANLALAGGYQEIMAQISLMGISPQEMDQIQVVIFKGGFPFGGDEMALLRSGGVILRSDRPINLQRIVDAVPGLTMTEASHAGTKYKRLQGGDIPAVAVYSPEPNTTIAAFEGSIYPFLEAAKGPKSAHPWAVGWASVAKDSVAIAWDNGFVRGLTETLGGGEGRQVLMMASAVSPLWEETKAHMVGLEIGTGFGVTAVADCGNEPGAESVRETTAALVTLARNAGKGGIEYLKSTVAATEEGKGFLMLYGRLIDSGREVLERASVERDGTLVRFRISAKLDLASLMPLLGAF